jgi:benzoate-CoA ligase
MNDLPVFPDDFNLAGYLLDRNVARHPGKVAVRVGDASYTYAQVDAMSRQVAGALAGLGVAMEQRVLLVLPDGIEFVAAWLGTLRAGAVFAMANTVHTAEEYLYYLDYTRAPVAIIHASVRERFEQVRGRARHLKTLLVAGDAGPHLSLEREMARASGDTPCAATHADDIAGWLFTSGSTGKPKAAVHLHQDFAFNIETYASRVLGMREDDVTLGVPKLFFGYATGTNLMFPFAAGGTTVLFPERSTSEGIYAHIARHRPTVLISVPTMINMMLQGLDGMPGGARPDLSCLRVVLSAGEALPGELYRRWQRAFGVEILDGIGSAEMFHIYISNRFGDVREDTLGKVVPGYEARIVGADGRDVAAGEQGTLWVRGGSTALCYWQRRESSRATFRGDWCVTGDQFRQDAEGYFHYCGRTDDMLKVSGIFVSPLEIEDCLLGHEAVREAAVVGEADADGLVKPKAYVALKDGREPSRELAVSLKAHVKQRLAPYKYPRWVSFVTALPRSDRGKVLRTDLRGGVESLLTVALSGPEEEKRDAR